MWTFLTLMIINVLFAVVDLLCIVLGDCQEYTIVMLIFNIGAAVVCGWAYKDSKKNGSFLP